MKNVRTSPSIPHAEYFPQPRPKVGPGRLFAVVAGDARDLVKYWPVIQNMVGQELKLRYHRSMLGFLWTLVNPILMMGTLTLVFSQVFGKQDWKEYAIFLFAGQLPWTMFAGSLAECSTCIVANEGLIRKIYLPKLVFPLARILVNLTTFVLSLAALYVLVGFMGAKFTPSMALLPVISLLLATFALGFGLILATANTFYRDIGHLITVILQAWYFATPIIWGESGLPKTLENREWLNPAYPFIRAFQLIIRDGQWPSLNLLLAAAGIATVSLGVGYVTFKCHESKLIYRL